MHAQRPRADAVRAGALGPSWPLRLRGAPARCWASTGAAGDAGGAPKMQGSRRRGPSPSGPTSLSSPASRRWAPSRALPADAEGAPQLEAYTTDRTPDSEPKLVDAADVDSHRSLRAQPWPPKSSLYLFRTDGKSCSRELVTGSGQLRFAHPSTQQHLLVWRERPRSVMVLKKRGAELAAEFVQVVRYLGETERMRVVVEPAEYDALVLAARLGGGGGGDGGAAPSSSSSSSATGSSTIDNPLAASTRYLYTYTPQERERGGLADAVDFVVCLGGDGVILHAGGLFGRSIPPVVSFHLGSMGFLTNHDFADFRSHLRSVIYGSERLEACDGGGAEGGAMAAAAAAAAAAGALDRSSVSGGSMGSGGGSMGGSMASGDYTTNYNNNNSSSSSSKHTNNMSSPPASPTTNNNPTTQQQPQQQNREGVMVTLRMRLECSVVRRGQEEPEQVYEVLNEVVVDRGADSFLTNLECLAAGRLITRVQADGVMLATPTGSTAYSAAAGGSMVHPNVPGILLTPVCPHSLNFRPVVLPDYVEIELRVPDAARCGAWVCFDGKHRQQLGRGDRVKVRMSPNPMPTINKADLTGDWFESLERCFRWSNRAEQKPLFLDDGGGGAVEGARAGVAAEADSSAASSPAGSSRDDDGGGGVGSGGSGDAMERAERAARRAAEAEAMARAFFTAAAAASAGGGGGGGGGAEQRQRQAAASAAAHSTATTTTSFL